MSKDNNTVDARNPAVERMAGNWELCRSLLGGTEKMREQGQKYLRKRKGEELDDYDERLKMATLYPAFSETIGTNAGRAFNKPMKVDDSVPDWIKKEVHPDVDREGRGLNPFAFTVFHDGLAMGLTHMLVDSPAVVAANREEQIKNRIRPYVVHIKPERIIDWQHEDGKLTQLRAYFEREEKVGAFGRRCVLQIRVYEIGKVTTYEQADKDDPKKWVETDSQPMPLDEIPFVTFYTNRIAFMEARPPLVELGYLNVKHWNNESDNDELTHVASVPILYVSGIDDEKFSLDIGAKRAIQLPTVEAKIGYCEHTGAAIDVGRKALAELKDSMREAGAKLLLRTSGTKTATQVGEESDNQNSALGRMCLDFNDAWEKVQYFLAKWRGQEEGGKCELQPNLDPDMNPVESFAALQGMNNSGNLSDETLFEEAKRRGFLPDSLEWEDEQERINNQPDKNTPPPTIVDPNNPNPPTDPNNPQPPAPAPAPVPAQ